VLSSTSAVQRMSLVGPAMVAVFDGVGGAPAADLASELAARAIHEAGPPHDEQAAAELLEHADRVLLDAAESDPSRTGMATTASVIALPEAGGRAVAVNVGDSLVAHLGADGLREVSVSDRLGRSKIVQSLGGSADAHMAPHVVSLELDEGDRLLLATDGLTDVVDVDTLEDVLRDHRDDAVELLLEMVENAGIPDDVTIMTVDIELDGVGSGSTAP
jgi:PPM family protein phosphatase